MEIFRRTGREPPPAIGIGIWFNKPSGRFRAGLVSFCFAAVFAMLSGIAFLAQDDSPTKPAQIHQQPVEVVAPSETLPGDRYIESCRANDVPIPPDWPDDRWIARGELPFVFAEFPDAKTNEVFTYEDPHGRGVCYALVRKNHNRFYEAVGIICQSRKTGKACFWDNVIPGERTDARIRGLEIELDMRKIGNGSNMRQRCTECHRGAKVFLIHPDTPLAAIKATKPDVRYTPIGQTDWENPPPLEHKGAGACSQCHELPKPTKRYCGLLRQAAEKTMPSKENPAGWDNPRPEFRDAIERLKVECAKLL
jgi:hypothetical protein